MEKVKLVIYWIARIAAALILVQTLYFKFTGAEESVYIFSKVGIEPWGRIGTGILELITAILLLLNATAWIGALLGLGLMAGAIFFHLTILGTEVKGDGGYLFLLALIVTLCCIFILAYNKQRILAVLSKFRQKK